MSYQYKITVNFANSIDTDICSNEKIFYKELHYDTLNISQNKLTIDCKRQNKKNINTSLHNFNSTFSKQVNKALTFMAVSVGMIPKIKNIEIIRYDSHGKVIDTFSENKINQPLNSKLSEELTWGIDDAKILLKETPLSHTILLASVYWLKAQDYNLEGGKFEKHWKSFNTIYTHMSGKDTEFDKLVFMKKYICSNSNMFPISIEFISEITSVDIRKLKIREMILNDYSKINNTKAYADFIKRYDDVRLNETFKQTLNYRKEFLTSKGLYTEVENHIKNSISQNKKFDEQLLSFYLIKYSYLNQFHKSPF